MDQISRSYSQIATSNFTQLFQTSHESLKPEHILSLVSEIMSQDPSLTNEQRELISYYIRPHFTELIEYASASSLKNVKIVAQKCALLLGNLDEFLSLASQRFLEGDDVAILEALDILEQNAEYHIGNQYLMGIWEEWCDIMLSQEPIQDTKQTFLKKLCHFMFVFDLEELGYDIIKMLEGESVTIDLNKIFEYKRSVISPLDFDYVSQMAQEFNSTGNAKNISKDLLDSLMRYISKERRQYLGTGKISEELTDYIKIQYPPEDHTWKIDDYIMMWLSLLDTIFFSSVESVEYLLQSIENNPEKREMIDSILARFCLTIVDGFDIMSNKERLLNGFYSPILLQFDAIEYREIQERIYGHMEELSLFEASREKINIESWNSNRLMRINQDTLIQRIYLPLSSLFDSNYSQIAKKHLRSLVFRGDRIEGLSLSLILCYYAVEYFLLYGRWPTISDKDFYECKRSCQITVLENQILTYAYPHQY